MASYDLLDNPPTKGLVVADDDVVAEFDFSEVDPDLTEDQVRALEEALDEPKPVAKLKPGTFRLMRQHRFMTIDQLYEQPPIEWFIEDLLPLVPRTMIQGAGGSFKSFLVLDWVLCAATGRAWFGHAVTQGPVLYMAGEGARGLPKRVDAWLERNNKQRSDLTNIDFMGAPFEFGRMASNDDLKELWRSVIDQIKPKYIVVDTLHTTISGLEENSNSDMGRVLDAATYIAGGNDGAHLIYVHHKGKSAPGSRGASALRDDFDATANLDRVSKSDGTFETILTKDKIRDIEEFKPLYITFKQHNPHDKLKSSLYIEEVTDTGKDPDKQKVSRRTAVDDAMDAITDHGMLATGWGADRITAELKAMDLGLKFSPRTVGRALEKLRAAAIEVEDIYRRKAEQEQEEDDGDDD